MVLNSSPPVKAQVIANTGQLPGESWIDFTAQRGEQNTLHAQKEDDKARQSHLQHETVQSRFLSGASKNSSIYIVSLFYLYLGSSDSIWS
jgi:hypothetical protein